jgi:hypothetical protein
MWSPKDFEEYSVGQRCRVFAGGFFCIVALSSPVGRNLRRWQTAVNGRRVDKLKTANACAGMIADRAERSDPVAMICYGP